ncbi:F0F1 ATP synthase subunit epsilon [Niveispirillum cyanobacteriorum]|uniref:ATP synthase epsilon chain n=1 Tax=Niveispirillum cyanobacteriorum TaxID=1612173 RepID=A0A2K9NHY8_9PROT|nr:F0F1 ATP synthase subunit epsilon [Niveispirillum cyanobacteriorum]AUN32704.1 F0F1 ATP synthase subunit epsilon [Niveispirillum cyanobacteriorum]GGE83408.1 ATP synthase epsilon chain [Niveispirillum cyanobacteriorum]
MRLHILTPLVTILDRTDISEISARDESGAFGIRPGHAPFLTALPPSVLTLRTEHGATLYAAVAGGMLRVDRDGVRVTSPDAATGSELAPLAARVAAEKAAGLHRQRESAAQERTLHAALVHHLLDSVTSDKAGDA